MPYEGEFAQFRSIHRIVSSERIAELLKGFQVRYRSDKSWELPRQLHLQDLPSPVITPRWVLAIDGSHAEVQVQNGYPQAEASYVTVASVLIDLDRIKELDSQRPIDPREFRKTEKAESIDCALPSCNVVFGDDTSPKVSLRRTLWQVLEETRMSDTGESLLDTYEALLTYKPESRAQRCPYDDCPRGTQEFTRGIGSYPCNCPKRNKLYSTDSLRTHEGMNPEGTNGAMFAEIMQVLERLWLVHFLRTLEARKWLPILKEMAIVLDGPLAVFGHPAWLSQAISSELKRINEKVRQATGGVDLLIIGIEKTGTFVTHFDDLDRSQDGSNDRVAKESALLLTDSYIKHHVVFSTSEKPYGEDTYFGRKLLFKARSGAKVVASLPFLADLHRETATAEPHQFPRLSDALHLLNQLVSSRFPNALSPLVSAHAEAAIPLNLGGKVLEQLAREYMAEVGP